MSGWRTTEALDLRTEVTAYAITYQARLCPARITLQGTRSDPQPQGARPRVSPFVLWSDETIPSLPISPPLTMKPNRHQALPHTLPPLPLLLRISPPLFPSPPSTQTQCISYRLPCMHLHAPCAFYSQYRDPLLAVGGFHCISMSAIATLPTRQANTPEQARTGRKRSCITTACRPCRKRKTKVSEVALNGQWLKHLAIDTWLSRV